ncbi:MAG: lysoplasmalogenase [Propionibacteriales bacterium]|nr:lysoplasmalogenase [Propionibacteriales bacterium]
MRRTLMIISTTALVLIFVVHLIAQAAGWTTVLELSLVALMPLLIISVLSHARRVDRQLTLVVVALVFSWLGDSMGTALVREVLVAVGLPWLDALVVGAFLVKLGFFLLAQICYILAFVPMWRRSVLHTRRWLLLPYAASVVVISGLLLPYAAALAGAIVAYAVVIAVMAVLATGGGRAAAIGGVLFMLSDTLVAAQQFVPGVNARITGVLIMATYVMAQALLAFTVTRRGGQHAGGDGAGSERCGQ